MPNSQKYIALFSLYWVIFLTSFGYFLVIPVLLDTIANPHAGIFSTHTIAALGEYFYATALAVGPIAGFILAPIVGRLSDKLGRKQILLACTFLALCSLFGEAYAIALHNPLLFIVAIGINGISSNTQPIAQAAISDISRIKRARAIRFSIDGFFITLGMLLGPIAGQYLSDNQLIPWFNHTTPFWIAGMMSLIVLCILFFVLPETHKTTKSQQHFSLYDIPASFLETLKIKPSLLRLLIAFFCAQSAWAQFYQYVGLYFTKHLNIAHAITANYYAAMGAAMSFGLLIIYPTTVKYIPMRTSAFYCFVISALCMFLVPLAKQSWELWTLGVIASIFIGLYFPTLLTLFSDLATESQQGWIMALSGALIGIAWLFTGFTAVGLQHISTVLPLVVSGLLLSISSTLMHHDNKLI